MTLHQIVVFPVIVVGKFSLNYKNKELVSLV